MRVDTFVREREGRMGVGMIEQSLCHHLQAQLTDYYRLIAVLESQLTSSSSTQGTNHELDEESGLTLKRLDVWIEEWKLRMRMMSVCVEGAKGKIFSSCRNTNGLLFYASCSRWSPGQFNPRIRRNWRPFRQKFH